MSSNDTVGETGDAQTDATDTDVTDTDVTDTDATDTVREAILAELAAELGDALVASHLAPGIDLTVRVSAEAWAATAEHLKEEMGFSYFNFLSAVDWLPSPFGRDMDSQVDLALDAPASPDDPETSGSGPIAQGLAGGDTRFQVLARVNDVVNNRAVTLKADVDEAAMSVPSWVRVYAGADWHERETWEMFGINFVGHPGLRHIYLPGAFEGNPLRKDYPLLARRVKPWPGIVDVELMPTEENEEADGQHDVADGQHDEADGQHDEATAEASGP